MINRYYESTIFENTEEQYESFMHDRNLNLIRQHTTQEFYRPDDKEYKNIATISHIWSVGDKYYKLADMYYGDSKDWWLIARFNNKPTEAHNKIGDVLLIPTRIEEVKRLFKV